MVSGDGADERLDVILSLSRCTRRKAGLDPVWRREGQRRRVVVVQTCCHVQTGLRRAQCHYASKFGAELTDNSASLKNLRTCAKPCRHKNLTCCSSWLVADSTWNSAKQNGHHKACLCKADVLNKAQRVLRTPQQRSQSRSRKRGPARTTAWLSTETVQFP